MITEFIWDFDGMLFDTYPHTTAALCEYFRRKGKIIDENEAFSQLKVSILQAFSFYGITKEEQQEFYEIENDLDFAPQGVPYDGIPEILKFIAENGGRNYLYTHRNYVALQYLERFGLQGLFTDFVTRDMAFPFKPAPDAINYIIEKHSLDKGTCMMLGDRLIDCGAGLNAGIKALLFDEFRFLSEGEYTYYVNTISELDEKVRTLMK